MTGAPRVATPTPAEAHGRAPLRQHPVLAGAILLFFVLTFAYSFSVGLRATRGASITADEPFYLMTTVSLIEDGNLDLRNQYARESWRQFFDHPDGLWRQSVPAANGQVLSPHEPGLSVLVIPGYLLDGLRGVQVQLMLLTALTFSLAYVLASRETGMPLLSWLVTAAVGLSATAFVYSTEIYPEVPAAFCLVAGVLLLRGEPRDVWSAALMAALVTVLMWFGLKYAPLGALMALLYVYKADLRSRFTFVALSAVSAGFYVWFHYAVFDDLTAYSVNTVYEGADAASVLQSHVSVPDRFYRLWGLLVDQRFGIGRWAPLFLALPAALVLLLQGQPVRRLILGLIATQVLIATFVAITMMGWWFPGRTLMAVLPLTALPLTLLVARLPALGRAGFALLAAVSLSFTLALRGAAGGGEVTLAVDPFDMGSPLFRAAGDAFPNYQAWTSETWALTVVWLTLLLGSMAVVAWREYGGALRLLAGRVALPRGAKERLESTP